MIRFDMSEFMEKHSVSKLIGSPPGYVGHEEGGQLTERIKRARLIQFYLFDEIEKAHPDIFNVLLQVFEDGILTDALGNAVDFKNAIIIMTSNIGARFIQKKGTMGFQGNVRCQPRKDGRDGDVAVRQTFNPEFINRLDEIIIFDELFDHELARCHPTSDRTNQHDDGSAMDLEVRLTDEAKRWIVIRPAPIDRTVPDRCGARCKNMLKIRCPKPSFRGISPERPSLNSLLTVTN